MSLFLGPAAPTFRAKIGLEAAGSLFDIVASYCRFADEC